MAKDFHITQLQNNNTKLKSFNLYFQVPNKLQKVPRKNEVPNCYRSRLRNRVEFVAHEIDGGAVPQLDQRGGIQIGRHC
jgi:hypothetical protein